MINLTMCLLWRLCWRDHCVLWAKTLNLYNKLRDLNWRLFKSISAKVVWTVCQRQAVLSLIRSCQAPPKWSWLVGNLNSFFLYIDLTSTEQWDVGLFFRKERANLISAGHLLQDYSCLNVLLDVKIGFYLLVYCYLNKNVNVCNIFHIAQCQNRLSWM